MPTWEQIWNARKAEGSFKGKNFSDIVLELKRLDGFDVMPGGLTFEAILEQYEYTKEMLLLNQKKSTETPQSVFEVGCGSGANIYLFSNDGFMVGGIDYSAPLMQVAKNIFGDECELINDEAIRTPTDNVYDSVFSNGVFSYFSGWEYAQQVLELMLKKCKQSIGLLDIHDEEKKEEFLKFRRSSIENYDEKYKGLDKLFFSREMFEGFAKKNNLGITFGTSDVAGYWNNEFVFSCFMYKK